MERGAWSGDLGNGASGSSGVVTTTNSLVGSSANDRVGSNGAGGAEQWQLCRPQLAVERGAWSGDSGAMAPVAAAASPPPLTRWSWQ